MKRERWESFVGSKATLTRYCGFSWTLAASRGVGLAAAVRRRCCDVPFGQVQLAGEVMDDDLGCDDLG